MLERGGIVFIYFDKIKKCTYISLVFTRIASLAPRTLCGKVHKEALDPTLSQLLWCTLATWSPG